MLLWVSFLFQSFIFDGYLPVNYLAHNAQKNCFYETYTLGDLDHPFTMQAYAQTSKTRTKNGYISVSVGPAFPVGNLADKNIRDNDEAGLAIGGPQLNIIFGRSFSKNFGFSMLWGAALHVLDKDPLNIPLKNAPVWAYGVRMIGPSLSFPSANGAVEFDVRALVGVMSVLSPELVPTNSSISKVSSFATNASAFGIGVGLRYHLSKKTSFITTLDYIISSNLEFNSSKPEFEDGFEEQKITVVNLSAGISYRLR